MLGALGLPIILVLSPFWIMSALLTSAVKALPSFPSQEGTPRAEPPIKNHSLYLMPFFVPDYSTYDDVIFEPEWAHQQKSSNLVYLLSNYVVKKVSNFKDELISN